MKTEFPIPFGGQTEPAGGELAAPLEPRPAILAASCPASDYEQWIEENEPDAGQLEAQRQASRHFSHRPKVSVLVPVYRAPLEVLKATVQSVQEQTYDNWELCVTVIRSEDPQGTVYLNREASRDPRIRVKVLGLNEGISRNSNHALELATGELLALLDHDDILAPFALFEVVQLLNQDRSANFIYSDKDEITEDGSRRLGPLFKPAWSPEVMLNANYLTHLCVMRTEHVREAGGWRPGTDGAQDWDLFLRLIRRHGNVRHIPKILYHWRKLPTSVAAGGLAAKPYAITAQVSVVQAHCDAIGLKASVGHEGGFLRIRWTDAPAGGVSIVVLSGAPTDDTLRRAARWRAQTGVKALEILAPAPGDAEEVEGVRRVEVPPDAPLAGQMVLAVRAASHGTLLFVDEHLEPADPDWLEEMTGPLEIPGVGLVGARLIDAETGLLGHCGLTFSSAGEVEYIHAGQPENFYERTGGSNWYRNWNAVSGACFAIQRDVWDALEPFSGERLHSRLDIHLCLKLRRQTDLRILYNPYARLRQRRAAAIEIPAHEDPAEDAAKIRAWLPDGDPYFSPGLECRGGKIFYRLRSSGSRGGLDRGAELPNTAARATSSSRPD